MKLAAGNPGRRPLNPDEPQPRVCAPRMPSWLSAMAKAEWKRIVPELARLGLMTVVDLAAISAYCQAFAELEEATRVLDQEGRVCTWPVVDKSGVKIGEKLKSHPAVQQQRDAARLVKQFISEFGLTPASRTRVHSGKGAEGDDPREARYFRRRT